MSYVSNVISDIVVFFPSDEVDVTVADDHIAIGGTVSVQAPTNTVDVTEHSFLALPTDEEVVLFDNTAEGSIADHQLVVFSEPMHDLTVSGITKHKGNCNYAIVSGTGTLTGKKYTHTRTIMSVTDKGADEEERLKQVTDNCLINEINSRSTAERVLSYFSEIDRIRSKLLLTTERTGDLIQFKNPFKEKTEAYIEKMEVLATSLLGANCELISGFNPQFIGNDFDNSILIDVDSTWTVPDDVTRIKVILIGGGQGGQGGSYGHRGAGYWYSDDPTAPRQYLTDSIWVSAYDNQPLFDGGAAGEPGSGGYILSLYFDVTPGEVLTFDIGAGGAGGDKGPVPGRNEYGAPGEYGSLGEHTTLQYGGETYSTENGSVSATGYLYLFGNLVLGLKGEAGHKGGAGGQTNTVSLAGWQYAKGLPGGSVGQWSGGTGGNGIKHKWWAGGPEDENSYNVASGGGGGGAAWGANGKNTHLRTYPVGTLTNSPSFYNGSNYAINSAAGGDGADAVKPTTPTYGCGGGGGNGGGSGGNIGGAKLTNRTSRDPLVEPRITLPEGGNAGAGSDGGNGGQGCAIIYY